MEELSTTQILIGILEYWKIYPTCFLPKKAIYQLVTKSAIKGFQNSSFIQTAFSALFWH